MGVRFTSTLLEQSKLVASPADDFQQPVKEIIVEKAGDLPNAWIGSNKDRILIVVDAGGRHPGLSIMMMLFLLP
jgi:hypothetical protein